MTRTQTALLVTAIALGVLLIGGWIAFFLIPAGSPQTVQPSAVETTATTTEAATSSSSLPPPKPVPTYAQAIPGAQTSAPIAPPSIAAKTAITAPATATLTVNGARFPLYAPAGSTLETAMAQLRAEGGFSYKAETYPGLGSFVTEIQGRAGGSGMYWILYVNGKKSSTGISSTRIRSGDGIEWKLEKSY